MLSKLITKVYSERCFLPSAIKPWQKTMCTLTGFFATGVGIPLMFCSCVVGTLKVFETIDKIEIKKDNIVTTTINSIPEIITPTTKENISNRIDRFNKRLNFHMIAGTTLLLTFPIYTLFLGAVYKDETKQYFANCRKLIPYIRSEQECCNIIRKTSVFTMRTGINCVVWFTAPIIFSTYYGIARTMYNDYIKKN